MGDMALETSVMASVEVGSTDIQRKTKRVAYASSDSRGRMPMAKHHAEGLDGRMCDRDGEGVGTHDVVLKVPVGRAALVFARARQRLRVSRPLLHKKGLL
jgi:hypothetical protein